MIMQGVCSSFLLECLRGVHTPTDVYRIALYTRDANLSLDTTTVYTADGEVRGAGYGVGGLTLTGYTSVLDQGIAFLDWADPIWPRATIVARAALIYNYSKGNRAVAVLDLDIDYASTNGTFTVEFPEPTAETALVRIGG